MTTYSAISDDNIVNLTAFFLLYTKSEWKWVKKLTIDCFIVIMDTEGCQIDRISHNWRQSARQHDGLSHCFNGKRDGDKNTPSAKFQCFTLTPGTCFNSLWPSDTIWWKRSGSTLAQVMACCLAAPSHYLNQCWLNRIGIPIIKIIWYHSGLIFNKIPCAWKDSPYIEMGLHAVINLKHEPQKIWNPCYLVVQFEIRHHNLIY